MSVISELNEQLVGILQDKVPLLKASGSYPVSFDGVELPVFYFTPSFFDPDTNPGTEQLALNVEFQGHLLVGEESGIQGIELLHNILYTLFDTKIPLENASKAKLKNAALDDFQIELPGVNSWRVEWQHTINLGGDIWVTDCLPPHTIHING